MVFGIIGYGRFGRLWAQALSRFGEVKVFDKNSQSDTSSPSIVFTSLQEVTKASIVFLLVPISEMEVVCKEIKSLLSAESVVVDCCSVKVYPVSVMKSCLDPKQSMVATHPLFGPDSVQRTGGLKDHKIIVCPLNTNEQQLAPLLKLFQDMQLNVFMSTPEEHDRNMAHTQGLVHFIGRGLQALELKPQDLATPDFQALVNIHHMVANDSMQLFLDMHQYNPYTAEIRERLIDELSKLDQRIEKRK